jgi:hypothetical protein
MSIGRPHDGPSGQGFFARFTLEVETADSARGAKRQLFEPIDVAKLATVGLKRLTKR